MEIDPVKYTVTRRSVLAMGAAALAAPSLAFAQTATSLTIAGVPEDSITPALYADQDGVFKRNGLNVTVQSQNSGSAIAAGVAGGAYQIGKSSLTALIIAHSRKIPFVLIAPAGLYDTNNAIVGLIVKSDSPVHSAADLNGKTLAVSSLNDLYTISTKAWIDQHGGNSSTIKLVEIPIEALPAAVEAGRVDAAPIIVPQLEEAVASGKVRVLGKPYDAIASQFLYAAWFTTADYAQKNAQAVAAFSKSIRDASTFCNGHHGDTVAMLAKFTSISPSVIGKMRRASYGTTLDPKLIQPVIDVAAKYKMIPAPFDAKELIDPALLR
jgi:NitT/TauT family transport system substrate-binding protein